MWETLLYVLGGVVIAWLIYRGIRNMPGAFSKANLGKSAQTLAVLALLLIAVIAFCVFALRLG